jgi:hypothetical protein
LAFCYAEKSHTQKATKNDPLGPDSLSSICGPLPSTPEFGFCHLIIFLSLLLFTLSRASQIRSPTLYLKQTNLLCRVDLRFYHAIPYPHTACPSPKTS